MTTLTYQQRIEALNQEFNLSPEEAEALKTPTSEPSNTTELENDNELNTRPSVQPAPVTLNTAPPAQAAPSPNANATTTTNSETQALAEASQTAQQAVVEIHTKKAADIAYEASINSTEVSNKNAEELSRMLQAAGMDPRSANSAIRKSNREVVNAIGAAVEAKRLNRNFHRDLGSFKNNFGANLITTLNGGKSPYADGVVAADARVAEAANAVQALSASEQLLLTSFEQASTLDDKSEAFALNAQAASQFIVDRGRELDVDNAEASNKSTVEAYLQITGGQQGDKTDEELQILAEAYFKKVEANRASSAESRVSAQEARKALTEAQVQEDREREHQATVIDIQQKYPEATANLSQDQALLVNAVILKQQERARTEQALSTEANRAEASLLQVKIAKLNADDASIFSRAKVDTYMQANELTTVDRDVVKYLMAKDEVLKVRRAAERKESNDIIQEELNTKELTRLKQIEAKVALADSIIQELTGDSESRVADYATNEKDQLASAAMLEGKRGYEETLKDLSDMQKVMTPANARVLDSAIRVGASDKKNDSFGSTLEASSSPPKTSMLYTGTEVVSTDPAFQAWQGKLTEAPSLQDLSKQVMNFYSKDRTRQVEAITDWYNQAYQNYAASPVTTALHLPVPTEAKMTYNSSYTKAAIMTSALLAPNNLLKLIDFENPYGDPRDPGYINAYLANNYGATN